MHTSFDGLQRQQKQRKNSIELYPDLMVFITFPLFAQAYEGVVFRPETRESRAAGAQ
jgi:hypothetical protein